MSLCASLALATILCSPLGARHQTEQTVTVGMRAQITQLILAGTKLVAKPIDDPNVPVVLRVLATYPHGSLFRYDLEYYALEPGLFDLRDYLTRKDGSSMTDLPQIPVNIKPVLPPGQFQPNKLVPTEPPSLGGYRGWMIAGGVLWVLGLFAILFVGHRRRSLEAATMVKPVTLADRLQPMVEAAQRGKLDAAGKAELERLLLTYWRRRAGLGDRKPGEALAELRKHADAGPLLRQLEEWLHQPRPRGDLDVNALLEPYRNAPAAETA